MVVWVEKRGSGVLLWRECGGEGVVLRGCRTFKELYGPEGVVCVSK